MKNRKYIQLIAALSKKELKRFRVYLQSPFFNKKQSIVQLFDFIHQFYPTYEHKKLNKLQAYSYIFPNQKYQEQTFRNLISDLYKLLEGFLLQQQLEQKSFFQQYFLLETLFERKVDKLYLQKFHALYKEQERNVKKNIHYYHHQYQIEQQAHSFNVARKSRVVNSNLSTILHSLDTYYLASKLRYYCALFNHRNLMSTDIQLPLLEEILSYIGTGIFDEIALIVVYYRLLLLLKEDKNEVHYQNLKTALSKYDEDLPLHDLQHIYTAVFNYCNKKLKSGQSSYLKEIFDWYKVMLDKGSLMADGYITPVTHFRNIVRAALRLGELDWAATFINDYQDKIAKVHRENMVGYCRATLHFFQKDYKIALVLLFKFELKDFFYYIEHKVLLVQVYYELAEQEALQSLLNAFRIYLLRDNHLAEHLKNSYYNFVRIVNRLLKLKLSFSSSKKDIITDIQQLTHIVEKEWLLEKAREL